MARAGRVPRRTQRRRPRPVRHHLVDAPPLVVHDLSPDRSLRGPEGGIMNTVFAVMFVQALMGAFDNLWHHELQARLPQRASARKELALHSAREAIYALLFAAFAWVQWEGAWAALPAALLVVEIGITCADFLEEDSSRKMPPFERVLHTVLAVGYGILLGFIAPVLAAWDQRPTSLRIVLFGFVFWVFLL